MHTNNTRLVVAVVALAGCFGGGMQRSKDLEGLAPAGVTEVKSGAGLVVTAGDFQLTLPSDFAPLRIGPQVVYTRPASGETVKLAAMRSAQPMDAAKQQAVLAAQGTMLSGVEKMMARFGDGTVSPPRIHGDALGVRGTIDVKGPMTRRAIHTIVVGARSLVTISIECSQPDVDLEARAQPILATLKPVPPAPAAPAPAAK